MQAGATVAGDTSGSQPWQLEMFGRSLKKRLKLAALLEIMGNVQDQVCLLLTCGDNNGALNWHFRARGGHWTWGDVAGDNLDEMSRFLGDPVHRVLEDSFPFPDGQFDCVVAIDVLEHLVQDEPFLKELHRVLRPHGRAIVTVPNGNPYLLANRLKRRFGMHPSVYGHTRAGYTPAELREAVAQVGLNPVGASGYSRFFTEAVELLINFGYVYVLSRKHGRARAGAIAPTSSGEFQTYGTANRLYRLAFPVLNLISGLDRLLPSAGNYAVISLAVKPDTADPTP